MGISVLTVLAESRARDARLAQAESKSDKPALAVDENVVRDPFAIVLGEAPEQDSIEEEASGPKQPIEEFFPIPEGAEAAPELSLVLSEPPWLKADQDGQLAGSLMVLASESAEQGAAQEARSTRLRARGLYETSLAHTTSALRSLARNYGSKSKLVLALKAKRRTWERQVQFIEGLLGESQPAGHSNSSAADSALEFGEHKSEEAVEQPKSDQTP